MKKFDLDKWLVERYHPLNLERIKKAHFNYDDVVEILNEALRQPPVVRIPYLKALEFAIIQNEFRAYEVRWKCQKGHTNFQTVLYLGTQTDICLKCNKHYEYVVH